jgi:dTDP-glucose 4,6-dehydratase
MNRCQNLLITGGAGFIGSHFVELALKQGAKAVVLDALTYAGHMDNLRGCEGNPGFSFVKGDIRDGELVGKLLRDNKIDALINFAAETHVDRSIDGPADFIETNVVGSFSLLRSSLGYFESLNGADREKFRYLQVSTDEVFGSLGEMGKFNENSQIRPNSPYSASKAGADHLVRAWFHTYGLPTVVTHCSNNYGPRQYPEKLIPFIITRAMRGEQLPVYGDGMNIRDWIHVEDHCSGVMAALERGAPGNHYCLGGNEEWRNIELVKLICEELDKLLPCKDGRKHASAITFVKDRAGHDRRYAIDDSIAIRELGYRHAHTFRAGVPATVKWYVENQEWCRKVLGKGGLK